MHHLCTWLSNLTSKSMKVCFLRWHYTAKNNAIHKLYCDKCNRQTFFYHSRWKSGFEKKNSVVFLEFFANYCGVASGVSSRLENEPTRPGKKEKLHEALGIECRFLMVLTWKIVVLLLPAGTFATICINSRPAGY